ncbi:hypothetical protein EV01_1244 [Prochlorococcus marinus str. MIT 9401]|uniref:Uncharacterized protein n=1 Tax=Prochlorococcus marinus str. MIT 9401 TaxID=167551 RepID=A0A0A2B4U7_PROMR|nr:hypothetical protein EV01_1244 [Prochlorococcus marinus str. MIT 9401]
MKSHLLHSFVVSNLCNSLCPKAKLRWENINPAKIKNIILFIQII